jgi:FkbM family methyltransferase
MQKPIPTIARYWPFANGSGRILDKYAKEIDLGTGERVGWTSDGFPLHVYAEDLIGRHILMSGKFDRSIVQVLLDHAQPGDVLLDIGANIGYVSACFLSKVRDGTACCVEPQPGIVDLLRKNMMQFDGRAQVMQVGLGDADGRLRFHVDTANRGASRISENGELEIPIKEARKLLETLPRVNLIKMDVEGFEETILRSMKSELKRLRPRAILFEDQTGSAAPGKEIGSILTGAGYRIYGIDKRLFKTALVPLQLGGDCQFNDYVALG